MASNGTIREQAVEWAVRTGDPSFTEWEPFMEWLEADPAHARAYDEVTAAVNDATKLLDGSLAANDNTAVPRKLSRRGALVGGALAASLAFVGAIWVIQGGSRDLYAVQTAPGEMRSLALDTGTRVDLAGGTSIVLDCNDTRFAKLDSGQALFTVRHDEAHPFEVMVGEERLVDIGTVFDVRRDEQGLSVAVSEGAVQFDPDGADLRIAPGEVLHRPAGTSQLTLSRIEIAQVGEWSKGRLTFSGASLEEVAASLKRATGVNYAAGSAGTVSGSILIESLRHSPAALGPLLGVSVKLQGDRWVIGAT